MINHNTRDTSPAFASADSLYLQRLEFAADDAPYVIPNDRAYRHTKSTVASMAKAMEDYRLRGGQNLAPALRQAVLDGMQSLIDEWSAQMQEYETLKNGRATLSIHSLRELPSALVKARIAAGLTQKQLGERLGLKPQQIQRYEATRYRTITLARMLEIAEALDLKFDARVQVGNSG